MMTASAAYSANALTAGMVVRAPLGARGETGTGEDERLEFWECEAECRLKMLRINSFGRGEFEDQRGRVTSTQSVRQ